MKDSLINSNIKAIAGSIFDLVRLALKGVQRPICFARSQQLTHHSFQNN